MLRAAASIMRTPSLSIKMAVPGSGLPAGVDLSIFWKNKP
jgi:hypothetical protein